MEIIGSLQDFFQVVLPYKIRALFEYIAYDMGALGWILFLISVIILSILFIKSSRKNLTSEKMIIRESQFLSKISTLNKSSEVLNEIFDFTYKTLLCKYSLFYELRGKTYVLVNYNTFYDHDKIGFSHRLTNDTLDRLSTSGNYNIMKIKSPNEKYLLLLFSNKINSIDRFLGTLKIAMSYFGIIEEELQITSDKQLAKINEETMQAIVKAQFGREGYLKFLISIILKIFNAKGGQIISHDNNEDYCVGDTTSQIQKEFFIRNTPYKFKYFSDNEITINEIREIGSFLDLSGSFLMSLDQQSSIMKNYINFLKNANTVFENSNAYYHEHSQKVQVVAIEVAKNLFMDQTTLNNLSLAAELHDIGMIGNMEVILNQNSELNSKDIDLMHYHPVIGSILLEPIAHLYPITNIIKQHHERFDGKGYPNSLKGNEITLDSQCLSLAEHFIGLISDRSYKKGLTFENATEEVKKVSGRMFDPVVVNSFIEVEKKIKKKLIKFEKLENNN